MAETLPETITPLGERVHMLRWRRRMTTRDLCALTGISLGAINNMERRSNDPRVSHVTALARLFGVSIEYLLGETDDPTSGLLRKDGPPEGAPQKKPRQGKTPGRKRKTGLAAVAAG